MATPPSSPVRAFVFAGGGTGGHLYPGIAVAEQIRAALGDRARFLFLTSDRAIDATVMREGGQGFDWIPLPARPPAAHPAKLLKFATGWRPAVRVAMDAISTLGHGAAHTVVISTGGFVSAPAVRAAMRLRVPVAMLNLDATPGKANLLVARVAVSAGVFTQMPVSGRFAEGWTLVPPIVRAAALHDESPAGCRTRLGLDPTRPVLLFTGGSLGAASINQSALAFARAHAADFARERWQILHQCGSKDEVTLREEYGALGLTAVVAPFVAEMGRWWGAADIAVSRAGAGSVAEAWANRVPTVFMPYPYHKDQHQKANAQRLVSAGGALVIDDQIEPARTLPALAGALLPLVREPARREAMRSALLGLGPADGARRLADALVALV